VTTNNQITKTNSTNTNKITASITKNTIIDNENMTTVMNQNTNDHMIIDLVNKIDSLTIEKNDITNKITTSDKDHIEATPDTRIDNQITTKHTIMAILRIEEDQHTTTTHTKIKQQEPIKHLWDEDDNISKDHITDTEIINIKDTTTLVTTVINSNEMETKPLIIRDRITESNGNNDNNITVNTNNKEN
jgi:hypothetical protein